MTDSLSGPLCRAGCLTGGNGVLGVTASVAPPLGGESLVVVLSEVHAVALPGVEVALGGDGTAAGPLVHTVADVLDEGGGTDDGGLVDLGVLPDVVDGAVTGDLAHLRALSGASAVAGVLLNVVLNKRVLGPSVDGDEDRAGRGGGGAGELDLPVSRVSGQSSNSKAFCAWSSYLLVPVFHPLPTTKSPALENWTE
jgi:hypothetical protein